MNWLHQLRLRFRALFQKEKFDAQMDDEMRSHIEMQTQENIEAGMTPDDARYAALRQFGRAESIKETCRDQRGLPGLETLWQDLRYGARQLRKNPGFTTVAVLTLAFGIGANTAMFSFVNAILLRPLPYKDPDRLVMLFENHLTNGWPKMECSVEVLNEWRRQSTAFEGLAARTYGNFTLTGIHSPETLNGSLFSANMFSLLGLKPLLGRDFLPSDETPGNHLVVILSYELWQRRFGGDAGIIGKSLTLGGEPFTVIGVMPGGTISPDGDYELWTPLVNKPVQSGDRLHNLQVFGRLKAGMSLEQARSEMRTIARRLEEANPQYGGWGVEVYPLQEVIVGGSRRLLLVLMTAVGLVLLVGCINIAALLLARAAGRAREFAVRAALGAGRGALIRQSLTESCLLALIGGLGGVVLARVGLDTLIRVSAADLPRMSEGLSLDETTLLFTAIVTLVTGLAFGLIPAFQLSRPALSRTLVETGRGAAGGRRQQLARSALVVGEVALSLVLLVGAGLTIRSFGRLLSQDTGFVPEHLVTMNVNPPGQRYPGQAERHQLYGPFLEAVRTIPGVDSAGYAFGAPLSRIYSKTSVTAPGSPEMEGERTVSAGYAQISPGYFEALKTPLLEGRDFSEHDNTNSTPVVIVDQSLVRNLQLGSSVVGKRIEIGDGSGMAEIVGVVADSKRTGMADPLRGEMYRPYRQVCWGVLTLVVRTQRDPADVTRAIRRELDRFDKDLPLDRVRTMSQLVSASVVRHRISVHLLTGFAGSALVLAAIGLYGVIACAVSQRTREIGIRMALGANRGSVLGLVLRQGLKLAGLGIALGVPAALGLTRVLTNLLYEVRPGDPFTFVVVSLMLLLVAVIACWLPARRAARVDPMVALRSE